MNARFEGGENDTLYFTDGKPWKMNRPGKGEANRLIAQLANATDVNLVQKAYYNGHYGFHGAKVQHMVQADGIMHSFVAPIRNHDAKVLKKSSMFTMINSLYIDSNQQRPVKCVTDKVYPRNDHFRPTYT